MYTCRHVDMVETGEFSGGQSSSVELVDQMKSLENRVQAVLLPQAAF